MKTVLLRLESPVLFSFQLNCQNQRLFLDLHVVKLLLYYINAVIGVDERRTDLNTCKEDARNELNRWTSLLCKELWTNSVSDLRPDGIEDSGGAMSRGTGKEPPDCTRGTFLEDSDRLTLLTLDRKPVGDSGRRIFGRVHSLPDCGLERSHVSSNVRSHEEDHVELQNNLIEFRLKIS